MNVFRKEKMMINNWNCMSGCMWSGTVLQHNAALRRKLATIHYLYPTCNAFFLWVTSFWSHVQVSPCQATEINAKIYKLNMHFSLVAYRGRCLSALPRQPPTVGLLNKLININEWICRAHLQRAQSKGWINEIDLGGINDRVEVALLKKINELEIWIQSPWSQTFVTCLRARGEMGLNWRFGRVLARALQVPQNI